MRLSSYLPELSELLSAAVDGNAPKGTVGARREEHPSEGLARYLPGVPWGEDQDYFPGEGRTALPVQGSVRRPIAVHSGPSR